MHDHRELPSAGMSETSDTRKNLNFKRTFPKLRKFIETCTQENNKELQFASQKYLFHFLDEPKFNRGKRKSNQAARPISTGRLNGLLHLHVQPIKRVVCPWSLGSLRSGKQYLGRSLALRCFQRLSLPHMATQRCP